MKKIIVVLILLIFFLYGCNIENSEGSDVSGNGENSIGVSETTSNGEQGNNGDDIPDFVVREGATLEEAEQTELLTDKNEYNHSDSINLTISCPFDDDYINYSDYIYIQFFDEEKEEWTNSTKIFDFIDVAIKDLGEAEYTIVITERTNNEGEKYRLSCEVKINDFEIGLKSNEFSINFDE